tara:strand:+ start:4891 stop:5904 length:1014 start_codon:yes stop_codon:yes gene_type:complete
MGKVILVTGGYGFIGSHFIKLALRYNNKIINIDNITYAANKLIIDEFKCIENLININADISNYKNIEEIFELHQPDCILNFAAESHVDNSIFDGMPFIETNIIGTYNLLQVALKYYVKYKKPGFKFLQVSTDEVFGTLSSFGQFNETSVIAPRNPYSASKAAADHFVNAFYNTYKLPAIITNCSNNFGRYQNFEKMIPKSINSILKDKPISLYGDGSNIRDWLFVEQHVASLMKILTKGRIGERYCIGGGVEFTNLQLISKIYDCAEIFLGNKVVRQIEYVEDRPGHDYRYSIDDDKFTKEFGESEKINFDEKLLDTVSWYLDCFSEKNKKGKNGAK